MQLRQGKTLQLSKCIVGNVNFHVNKCSYGYKPFSSTIKLIQQRYSETLQLEKCVVKEANFHVNKCSYGYKTLQFNELSKYNKGKVKHYN